MVVVDLIEVVIPTLMNRNGRGRKSDQGSQNLGSGIISTVGL